MRQKLIGFDIVALIQIGFLFGTLSQCMGQADQTRGNSNRRIILAALQPVLLADKEGSRIEYAAARCSTNPKSSLFFPADIIPFPQINVKSPKQGQSGVAAVGEMFSDDKGVRVADRVPGVVDITIGDVPDAILGVRISSLKLRRTERYDPAAAIGAIEQTKEVDAFMRQTNMSLPPILGGLITPPLPELPHMRSHLTNVTFGEALDLIAKTFGGIVVYGTCERPNNLFYVDFVSLQGGM